ncbi:DUF3099 domain-containing protein [Microbacterium hominis]|uniref:DUF3099 domain-containing protein n=1 Tax=Microbacterium hominis TaxID=162426 RepID=UPI0019643881|nr:DUF3099 domain-containing protein [Microbacterium hominis]QRY41265.1 DUF3099 domain-containing protein [Microbacterium hominis]
MKSSRPQSATSLPRAPRDDASVRMTKYFTMMVIRVACFVLMVAVTPYGWYTWLFGAGAMFLPYFAVVIANVAAGPAERAIPPERAIESPAPPPASAQPTSPAAPTVIRITESPAPPTTSTDPT